jgi:chemotaxis protein MotB
MRRKGRHEEHENLERWLVSYADFITLLFAFFVVMYSISSVNEGKYKVLSETLNTAFSTTTKQLGYIERTADPIQLGTITQSVDGAELPIVPDKRPSSPDVVDTGGGGSAGEDKAQLQGVADRIERELAPYIQDDVIQLKRHDSWIEVEMKSGLLFPSGRADLSVEVTPMLEKLSDIFKSVQNTIQVEGHTDNKPINTREFPSNWELSAARAASVVHQLMRNGIEPHRMAAIGYGEHHPIQSNDTEDGRYRNRRVTIKLQSKSADKAPVAGAPTPPAAAR